MAEVRLEEMPVQAEMHERRTGGMRSGPERVAARLSAGLRLRIALGAVGG